MHTYPPTITHFIALVLAGNECSNCHMRHSGAELRCSWQNRPLHAEQNLFKLFTRKKCVFAGIETVGKNVLVAGRSKNVGMPIAMLLHTDRNHERPGGKCSVCESCVPVSQHYKMTGLM